MARNIYGLDLGTYEIKVFDRKKDRIWREKNVIAMKDKKYIFSVGDEAYEMYEKAPDNIQVVFPMKNGVIARQMLQKSRRRLSTILSFTQKQGQSLSAL